MRSQRSIAALVISLLVHAMIALAAASMLEQPQERPLPTKDSMVVQLKQPSLPVPAAQAPAPLPMLPAPSEPTPKPARKDTQKPAPAKPSTPVARSNPAATPTEPAPVQPSALPQQDQSAPSASTPVLTPSTPSSATLPPAAPIPSAPARTGASIPASYAAANRPPEYPALSRRYGEQGTVMLKVLVKADGTAGTVEITRSSGYPLLDAAAKNTVQSWRFHPATSDGKPVAEWYPLPITFTLQE